MQHVPLFSVPFYRSFVHEHSEIEQLIPIKKIKKLAIHPSPWKCNVLTSIDPNQTEKFDIKNQWNENFYKICGNYVREFIKLTFNPKNGQVNFNQCWINLYKRNSFQEWHNHLGIDSMFSFCYFYKIPEDENTGQFLIRSKLLDLEFFYPQHLKTQNVVQPNACQHEIFIFPSWLDHMVTQHNCDEERITISGNFSIS